MIIAIIVIGLISLWSAWATWQNTKSIKRLLAITIQLNESKYGEVIQIKDGEQE